MAENKRIFYAAHQVSISADNAGVAMGTALAARGVQSVGISTNFNLEQVFELGKLSLYENVEEIPDVEISVSKVLDGRPLLFHMATQGTDTVTPDLIGRSNTKCQVGLGIFTDTDLATSGETSVAAMVASGMFVSSVGYNFGLDGTSTEDVSLVGNNKAWTESPNYGDDFGAGFSGYIANIAVNRGYGEDDTPISTATGVSRRQDIQFDIDSTVSLDANEAVADPDATILPPEVFGITTSGTNELAADGTYKCHVAALSVSADLGREAINELGRRSPYHRTIAFPVEITTEIEVTSHSGDMGSAIEEGIYKAANACEEGRNLTDRTIRIATCEGTRLYMGLKNKLASVNYGGGDTGGGNVSVTYSFTTFNDLTVLHPQDPHASGSEWWANKTTYLTG